MKILALLTLSHYASVERLKGPDIVRIKLAERADLFCGDVHTGVFSTNQLTPSAQGGAVTDPM